jgi:hypothetical protein
MDPPAVNGKRYTMFVGPNEAKPLARKDDLVVEPLEDELLVYDITADKAHCLNAMAALVWQHCDGQTSLSRLVELVEQNLPSPVGVDVTSLALRELSRKGLLTERLPGPTSTLISRRSLIRSLGLAAGSLPLITSIVSPTPAQAATCLSPGQACTTSTECCSAVCQTGTTGTCA